MQETISVGMSMVMLIGVFVLYMLPLFTALVRRHKNSLAIAILNFFVGWTVLGWIIALVWACTDNTR